MRCGQFIYSIRHKKRLLHEFCIGGSSINFKALNYECCQNRITRGKKHPLLNFVSFTHWLEEWKVAIRILSSIAMILFGGLSEQHQP